jgi:hypothetical protein
MSSTRDLLDALRRAEVAEAKLARNLSQTQQIRGRFRGMTTHDALTFLMREHNWTDDANMDNLADDILSLLLPADNVVLTIEEANRAAQWFDELTDVVPFSGADLSLSDKLQGIQ